MGTGSKPEHPDLNTKVSSASQRDINSGGANEPHWFVLVQGGGAVMNSESEDQWPRP